ncbi:acyl-CoA dehydrogenase [Herbidospora sp. NEAU-GS84]|uniref:Acyl-CoA dehydrogenase n=1 Tax=Herbidospora solisilvae TaxID=2696284 RepID=A0A7C9NB94_9ACTN|nr:acyl-CoA dehydrogenase family protein [Herbidospora solisilvae]NAS20195.1 acyl-CoA dehydrogenase [Herbidospora solisilvae]
MRRTVYTADHEAFRESVREFVAREVEPHAARFAEERLIGPPVWRAAGRLGLLGLEIPEEYGGGAAGDYRFNAVLHEELAAHGMALASGFGIHFDIVAPYLVDLTTEEQKKRWLPGFCSGELVTAIGMTEPGGGSDLAALTTTAVRDGDDWVLNGSKTFITNGVQAGLVVVAARTGPGKKGITLFGVEAGMPGFERGRKLDKMGQPEADTAELFFRDVRVPAANVIGPVDGGFVAMMERLPQERLGAAVANLAHAWSALAETLAYVRERRAFGQPVGSFQYNKFTLAGLVTELEVTRAYVDQCVAAHAARELSAVEAAKAKLWSSEVQWRVLDACVQLFGGYGYMREHRVARAWADARVTRIWAGSSEIMREIIGRDLGL